MIPFLMHRKQASVIGSVKPEGGIEIEKEEGEMPPELMAAAEDMLRAINMKDAKALAEALLSADTIMDSLQEGEE